MNGHEAAAACDVLITALEETKEFYIEGGEYLPLGVWMTRGFDAVHIKERSRDSDVIQDPVLGTVYRVRILSKGNAGSRTTVTTRNLKRKQPTEEQPVDSGGAGISGDGMQAIEGQPVIPALMDGTAGSDNPSSSDSSDSSSSSSSSSDKKKKKSKKDKKGKKGKKGKKDKKDKKKAKKEHKAKKDL
jgi:hypothetical protein